MSLRNAIAVVGVGESPIGKVPDFTGLGLNAFAAKQAIEDAGLEPAQIDGLLTAYTFTERYTFLATVLSEYLGIQPTYAASMVVGGATPGILLHHAAAAIVTGQATNVLILTGENRRTGITGEEAVAMLASSVGHPNYEEPFGPSLPSLYAMVARRHMHEHGTTPEQLASVAVTARYHASMNPSAPRKDLITVDDVLSSRMIADPLHLLDCCLISDAGGAIVVTSAERAADLAKAPVYLRGIGEKHTHEHVTMADDLISTGARESSRAAYAMAGISPDEADLAMLYDCFTIVPVIEAEELGLVGPGEAGSFFEEGHARLGGTLPINTHGGMLSHAHAGAVGGLFDIVEATRQLRGENGERQVPRAELAIVHVEGGMLSSHCTMVLSNVK